MNWSRVRWLLIICLCLADLLLGLLLWRNYRGENMISRSAIEDAAQLLADANVTLNPDVVPTAVVGDHVFRVPVSDGGYRAVFAALIGSPVTSAYLLPASSGVSLLFENGDSVEYYHNLYLMYTRDGADKERLSALISAYSGDNPMFVPLDTAETEQDAAAAEEFLSALTPGESSGARLRPRLEQVYAVTGEAPLRLAVFREEIVYRSSGRSAADIYDTEVLVLIANGTVQMLAGTWVPFLPDETYSIKKLDQLNILFSERKRHQQLDMEGETDGLDHALQHTDAGCELVSMRRLYYMLWDDAGTLYLRPSWLLGYRLEQEDHTPILREVLCDGLTGNVVRQQETVLPG
ncbi:MAG: hypothetical protein E7604_01455 [Ruminococcaceae bacterium]|nr:hypothetical protein [Oscillospiraceae bacterium]